MTEPLTPEIKPDTHPALPQDRISSNPFFKKAAPLQPQAAPLFARVEAPRRKLPSGKLFGVLGVVLLLVLGGFFVVGRFASAVIDVVPLTKPASFDHEFTAVKEGQEGDLVFHFMSLAEEKTKEVPAKTEQKVQKKASGKVIIKNEYSAQSQRLIKNTRLETADHKIYRIDESVVVPGAKMSGSTVVTPGSVEAIVYADVPGEEYNIKPSGTIFFSIPGFKGDPRFSKFTAMTDSPITGGYSGTVKVPSSEDVLAAQAALKEDLAKLAVDKARANMKEGTTFFPGSMVVKFEEVPQEFSQEDTAKVSMRATVSVFFFETESLMKAFSRAVLGSEASTPMALQTTEGLKFMFVDQVSNVVLSDLTHIRFRVNGEGIFVGVIDTQKLTQDLAGKTKDMFMETVQKDSNIKKATLSIFPPWQTGFPEDSKKISVKISSQE